MSAWRQRDFLLRETLDAISDHVNACSPKLSDRMTVGNHFPQTSFVAGVELKHSFFVCIPKQLSRKAKNRCGFANTWHARYDDMRHIAIFGYDFESLDRFRVADNVIQEDRSVLFDPASRKQISHFRAGKRQTKVVRSQD